MNAPAAVAGTQDIIDAVIAAANTKTFANALRAASLVGTLKGTGPFTVFAPTDEAFNKLAPGALHALLKDKAKLAEILNYHIVPGEILAHDLPTGEIETMQGMTLSIVVSGASVTVNDAKVTKIDIETSNGVVHVIDAVMMPNE